MSSAGKRERKLPLSLAVPGLRLKYDGKSKTTDVKLAEGAQLTVSESHRRNPNTGNFDAGGPFYTSHVAYIINPGSVSNALLTQGGNKFFYSGPVLGAFPTPGEMESVGYSNSSLKYGDKNESSLKALGTTAISLTSPVNPASNLGTTMAETVREGIPSIPGIQSWRHRTELLKGAGSEYLNYQFGWAPLVDEVSSVRDAARRHRDIMTAYQNGEGSNTRREFSFPLSHGLRSKDVGGEWPLLVGMTDSRSVTGNKTPRRVISWTTETRRWFSGCYTYALPSSSDKWRKALGFGSQADQLFGLTLTPDVLWELTPWSWAVDWFSNAGEVINNVTNFGLAGQVMRYGYMMEESIDTITASLNGPCEFYSETSSGKPTTADSSPCSSSIQCVTKRRVPASPFGFSVGWEGLSPTQLAITAALGITKLL